VKKKTSRRPPSDRLVSRIVSSMGKGRGDGLVRLGSEVPLTIPGVISTRCPTLDAATKRGGVPLARLTIITGDPSTGKTTLGFQLCAEVQERGGIAVFIDAERKADWGYARDLGVKLGDLIVPRPKHLEECCQLLRGMVTAVREKDAATPVLVVLDSINAAIAEGDYESDYGDSPRPGSQASVMSWILPKLIVDMDGLSVALVFISQTREMIGAYKARKKIAGGRAPEFYSALVIDLARRKQVKDGGEEGGGKAVAQNVEATIIKSQIGMPWAKADFVVRFGEGVDYEDALLRQAEKEGVLNSGAGGWYDMPPLTNGGKPIKWQGVRGFRKLIADRTEVLEAIEAKLKFGRKQ